MGKKEAIDTMTDDIKVTVNDVLTVNDALVREIIDNDESKLPMVKELLIAIYIRGFFTGAHLKASDVTMPELMVEMVKSKLEN